jgi:hypothetical protein
LRSKEARVIGLGDSVLWVKSSAETRQAGSRAVTAEDGTYRIYHGEFLLKQIEVKGDIRDIYI